METAVAYAGFMAFFTEMVAPLVLCSSIPLGSPPVQDPNLGRIAPKECIAYVGWAGVGTPDAKSPNSAERFLADPEIRHMRAEAARRFRLLMKRYGSPSKDANAQQVGLFTIPPGVGEDIELLSELVATRPSAGFVSHVAGSDTSLMSQGAFVVNVGDAGPKVAAMLKRFSEIAKDAIEENNIDGQIEYRFKTTPPPAIPNEQFDPYAAPEASAFYVPTPTPTASPENVPGALKVAPVPPSSQPAHSNLRWSLRGEYLIVTWGAESPAGILARMKRPEPEWFTAVAKDLPIERRAAIVHVSLDTLAADCDRSPVTRDSASQIRNSHIRTVTLVTGLGHHDFVSQLLVETDVVAGALLKTMINRPLKAEDLAVIPRDATLAAALRINPHLIATGLRCLDAQVKKAKAESEASGAKNDEDDAPESIDASALLFSVVPAPLDAGQKVFRRLCRRPTGFDEEICSELAASLDDAWRIYTSSSEGSSILNGMTGVVRVKDAARLTKLFEKLATRKPAEKSDAKKADEPADQWAVRKTRFADRDVYYLVRSEGKAAGVLTWCLVKNELVCSLSPQNVKAFLLRQQGGSSLADEPAVVEALLGKQSPTMVMYEDAKEMFRLTYPLMQGYAMVAAAQNALPTDGIDPMLLPASPTIAKYLRPAVSSLSVVPKGVQLTIHQSLPNGNLGATLYCVMCSLVPANGESLSEVSPFSPIMPSYAANPVRTQGEMPAAPVESCPPNPGPGVAPVAPYSSAPPTPAVAAPCEAAPTPTYSVPPPIPAAGTGRPYIASVQPNSGTPVYSPPAAASVAGASPPPGCQAIVAYVPMVVYVPMGTVPNMAPPTSRLPAVSPYSSWPSPPNGHPPTPYQSPNAAGTIAPPFDPYASPYTPTPRTMNGPACPTVAPIQPAARPVLANPPRPITGLRSDAPLSDQGIATEIAHRLRNNSTLTDYRISVTCRNGMARLKGRVASQEQLHAAMRLASDAPGVKHVYNEMTVALSDNAQPGVSVAADSGEITIANSPPTAIPGPTMSGQPPIVAVPAAVPNSPVPPVAADATFSEKQGPCKLKRQRPFDKDVFTVEVGQNMRATCKFYIDDFFGRTIINANMSVKNVSKQRRNCQYYVAFFDKNGKLVGCAGQGLGESGLAPGRDMSVGSCLVFVPDGMAETVTSYQVRLYETSPIEKKKSR